MSEIQISGLQGLYNRINMFASIQQRDVVDVTVKMDKVPNSSLSTNKVMMLSRTENILNTGRDISPSQFYSILSNHSASMDMTPYYRMVRKYSPEFNTASSNMGTGYRQTANRIMLIARATQFIYSGKDLFPYEYIQTLANNMSEKRR